MHVADSKAMLTYARRGMHLGTFDAREFQGSDGTYYRAELYRDDQGSIRAASYRREVSHWMPFLNPFLGIALREMMDECETKMLEAA